MQVYLHEIAAGKIDNMRWHAKQVPRPCTNAQYLHYNWHQYIVIALYEQGEKSKVPESSGFIFIHEDTGKAYKETGLTHIVL